MSPQCIDMDMFTAYFGQYISQEDRNRVEKHLANCNECMNLFAIAAETLLDPEIYEYEPIGKTKAHNLLKSLKLRMERFIQWSRNQFPPQWTYDACPVYQPIPVMVRTSENSIDSESIIENMDPPQAPIDFVHMEKDMDQLHVEIFVEHTSENRISLKVRATVDKTKRDDIFVYLERMEKGFIAKPLINQYVLFEDLPYDTYLIKLEYENQIKGNFEFKINQNGILLDKLIFGQE
jgi:hypothetical protein